MKKGLFWKIPNDNGEQKLLTYAAVCDSNGVIEKGQPAYNSKKGDSFSHERTWPLVAEGLPQRIRSKPWNFYPRGRVEMSNGKATVYHNPLLAEWVGLEAAVVREFELDSFPVRVVPDYSNHYEFKEE